jgi:phage gp36-like protein
MAAVFDKIRLIYKKRDETQTPMPKKLIAKSVINKIDDLAVEFDEKLTETMISLCKSLKDKALSNS